MNNNTVIRVVKDDNEFAKIGLLDDQNVKIDKNKKTTITFQEPGNQAYYISDFEARYLIIVSRSLCSTLDEFERFLQQKKWGQCLYLDAFLPKFLRNFYMLLGIARNNVSKYSDRICIFEHKYDVSLNSSLSDDRIFHWKNDTDRLIKLRIASKEVIHQLRLWEKRELANKKRNKEVSLSAKVEESLDFFVKIYFGISYSDDCPNNGFSKVRKPI